MSSTGIAWSWPLYYTTPSYAALYIISYVLARNTKCVRPQYLMNFSFDSFLVLPLDPFPFRVAAEQKGGQG